MKEKKGFYKEIYFNNCQEAAKVKEESEEQLRVAESVKKTAKIATVFGFIGLIPIFSIFLTVALVMGLICYKKIGGFSTAFNWAVNVGTVGWLFVPIPLNLMACPLAFVVAFVAALCLPYFVLRSHMKQLTMNIEKADEFLKKYGSKK